MCPSHLPTIAQLVRGNLRSLFETVAQRSMAAVENIPKSKVLVMNSNLNTFPRCV